MEEPKEKLHEYLINLIEKIIIKYLRTIIKLNVRLGQLLKATSLSINSQDPYPRILHT